MNLQTPIRHYLTTIAALIAALCAFGTLMSLSFHGGHLIDSLRLRTDTGLVWNIPAQVSMATMLLLCVGSLLALEQRRLILAAALSGVVAATVCATIASWVMNIDPPFDVYLFSGKDLEPARFPSATARDTAIPIALASLALAALAFKVARHVTSAIAWGTGLVLALAPGLRYLASLVASWIPFPLAHQSSTHSSVLLWSSVTFLGVALLTSKTANANSGRWLHTDTAMPIAVDWGARLRATIVVLVVAITLALWHAVRAAEIRQLISEVEAAADVTAKNLRTEFAANDSAAARLHSYWTNLGWPIPDGLFVDDSRSIVGDFPSLAALIYTDREGRPRQIAVNANALTISTSDKNTVTAVDPNEFGLMPLNREHALDIAIRAIRSESIVADPAIKLSNGVELFPNARTAVAKNGQVVGAFVILYRRDIALKQILHDSAPEFHVRLLINGEPAFERTAAHGDARDAVQYRAIQREIIDNDQFTFELIPGSVVINRNLSITPALVLLFAWVALILLVFALYNERRAYTLARERERILNESLDLICTLDANACYVTVNATSLPVLGYHPSELVGRPYHEFAHPGERDLLNRLWQEAQKGVRPPVTPLRFMHKDGSVVYLQGNAHWSQEEQLFYCDMRDVSEQHSLEVARKHAADTLDAGVEQAGCVVYEYMYETQQINWVGAIRALTGFEPETLNAGGFEGWMHAIHPDDRGHVRHTLQRCFETRQPHTIDYRLRRKDGEYVPVLDRGRYVEDVSHEQARMIGALIDLTAIRQQENALRRSEERYRIIATQVGAVIIERDNPSGRVRVFGPVEQIFGYTKEQMESRPYGGDDTMIHDEDRPRVFAAIVEAERTLSTYYVEYRRRHRGGHYIYIAARGVVLPGANGKPERSVIAITDITERKLAEQRLQESEERFRLAAEQAKQIVYEFNYDEHMTIRSMRFAGAIEQLLGYDVEEFNLIHRDNHLALFHPDDIPIARNLPAAVVNELGSFQVEHRMRRRDGSYVYVENRAAARNDAAGNLTGIVGMLLDISARKAAELERLTYTDQLAKLAGIARKVSTLLSMHELLNYLARSMRDLLGVNAAAIAVHSSESTDDIKSAVSYAEHYGLQRGESRPFGSAELHALLDASDKPVRLSTQVVRSDERWSSLTQNDDLQHPLRGWLAAPLITHHGARIGLLEVTDKSNGEFSETDAQVLSQLAGLASVAVENIRLYATLEDRVAERTRELQISNRELEAFSYSVSHDLRAPLRAIAGFSSILEQEYSSKLDATARRYLQRISGGVERMANLIDDLLSLARVSRLDLKRESLDLSGLCRTIAKRQLERVPEREINIKIDPRMRIDADPRLVEVAIENLIENAIKFTGTRTETRIHIGKRNVNGKSAFFVSDNGVGFDPKYAANLFGVFQRLHSASEFPGTGVGLATVQRIMQRHHGRVWAEAEIDHGAVFYFAFDSEV